ncbi:MAG: hypothetical protein SOV50_00605 [Lentihominibacter sp.]|nr:hypothetical protein [Clostridiales bacterium]MDD6648152.1 hypothetical protein [Bacillota bacterium]MDY2679145.1 hypothetical protein [Lentihominibacter sp.]
MKGTIMISKINSILRWMFVITGGVFVLTRIIDMQSEKIESAEEEFQTKEFDDIW